MTPRATQGNLNTATAALLCFDFDGTLVDRQSDPTFEPVLADHLRDLTGRGAAWVINTGRSLPHTLEGILDHGIPLAPGFIIAREHEIFTRNAAGRWTDLGDWNARCRRKHTRFYKSHRKFFDTVRAFAAQDGRALWIDNNLDPAGLVARTEADMAVIIDFIEDRRGKFPELGYQRNSIHLRFTHCDFDKGSALTELARQLSIGPAAIFAAGDNHNDLSMLRSSIAHGLCCPSNALPEVKSQVRREGGLIASSPGSLGMIEGLRHYFYR